MAMARLLCLIGGAAGYYLAVARPRRRLRRRLLARPRLTPGEFYERYYLLSDIRKESVHRALRFIDRNTTLDAARLRPDDPLLEMVASSDACPVDSDADALVNAITGRFPALGDPAGTLRTVDELIRTWDRLAPGGIGPEDE